MSITTSTRPNVVELWNGIHKAQEECAELGQVLAKLAAYPSGQHPDRILDPSLPPLMRRVEDELADVLAAVQWFIGYHRGRLDTSRILSRIMTKHMSFDEWHMQGVLTIVDEHYVTEGHDIPDPSNSPVNDIITSSLMAMATGKPFEDSVIKVYKNSSRATVEPTTEPTSRDFGEFA